MILYSFETRKHNYILFILTFTCARGILTNVAIVNIILSDKKENCTKSRNLNYRNVDLIEMY